jgi:hypothetical protein
MERLLTKHWVIAEEISKAPKRIKYIAKSPMKVINDIIMEKEMELKHLKERGLYIGDKLDQLYQGAKKLTIDTIHPGGYKYLKPLIERGWKIKTEVIEHLEGDRVLTLDYELKGEKGIPKDSGLIIFNYDRFIEDDERLLEEAKRVFKTKTEYEIRNDKIPGFEDIEFEEIKIKDKYPGFNIYIKLKFKKKLWLAGKQVIIPIKNRVFLLFGNNENFEIILTVILDSEKFHHLV